MDVDAPTFDSTKWGAGRVPKVVQEEDVYPSIEEDEHVDIREFHYFRDTGKLTASFIPKNQRGCFFVVFRRGRASDAARDEINAMYDKADYEGVAYNMKLYKSLLFPFLNHLKNLAKPEIMRRINDPVCLRVSKVLQSFQVPEGFELYPHTKKCHRFILDFGVRLQKISEVEAVLKAHKPARRGRGGTAAHNSPNRTGGGAARVARAPCSGASTRGGSSNSATVLSARTGAARGPSESASGRHSPEPRATSAADEVISRSRSASPQPEASSSSSSSSSSAAAATATHSCLTARSDGRTSPSSSRGGPSRPTTRNGGESEADHDAVGTGVSFGNYYNSDDDGDDDDTVDESLLPPLTYYHCLANDQCRRKPTIITVKRFIPKFPGELNRHPECSNVIDHLREKHWNILLQAGYKNI